MSNLADILRLFQFPSSAQKQPKVIKLNFRDIKFIGHIDPLYHPIEELSLNHNHLESLEGIQQFHALKILHLNFNDLNSAAELLNVSQALRELEIKQNPRC
jgi:Leucine-rich repeat (LRR) protein